MLSLLLVILIHPFLDDGVVEGVILGVLISIPLLLATTKMSRRKGSMWPPVLLMSCAIILAVAQLFFPSRSLVAIKWVMLTAYVATLAFGLFSNLKEARTITNDQLYSAVSIYLLLGLLWYGMYSAIETASPGSFLHSSSQVADRQSDLLYFSLVTLSTIGYGDILPVRNEVRMLAALEGVVGVLYLAIMVSLLVNSYKRQDNPSD
jgi:membrane-bound ClpP family serine protease